MIEKASPIEQNPQKKGFIHQPHPFSEEDQKQFGKTYEICYLSYEIITIVCQADKTQDDRSLYYRLINAIETEYGHISQQSKTQVLKIFKSGIKIDKSLFEKQRIEELIDGQEKMTFFPTQTVTRQIFLQLKRSHILQLTCGLYGISKTTSVHLYKILSDNISDFKILKISKYGNNIGIIPIEYKKIKKVFIWNVSLGVSLQKVYEILFNQFTEIQKNRLKKMSIQTFESEGINKFCDQFSIKLFLVMDQINKIFSKMRKVKYRIRYFQTYDDESEYMKKNPDKAEIMKFQQIILKLNDNFIYFFGLSSMNIQEDLFRQLRYHKSDMRISYMIQEKIQFYQKIKDQRHKKQMIDFFIFMLQHKQIIQISESKISGKEQESKQNPKLYELSSQNLKTKIRNEILNVLNSLSNKQLLLTQLFIVQYIKTKSKKIKVAFIIDDSMIQDGKVRNFLKEIFYEINESITIQIINDLQKFLQKDSQLEPLRRLFLNTIFQSQQKLQTCSQGFLKIRFDHLTIQFNLFGIRYLQKLVEANIFQIMSQNRFQQQQKKFIRILFPLKLLKRELVNRLRSQLLNQIESYDAAIFFNIFKDSRDVDN